MEERPSREIAKRVRALMDELVAHEFGVPKDPIEKIDLYCTKMFIIMGLMYECLDEQEMLAAEECISQRIRRMLSQASGRQAKSC